MDPPTPNATDDELKAAFIIVLQSEVRVSIQKIRTEFLDQIKGFTEEPWKTLLKNVRLAEEELFRDALTAPFDASVKRGLQELKDLKVKMPVREITHRPPTDDPNVPVNDLTDTNNKTHEYFIYQVNGTPPWEATLRQVTTLQAKLVEHVKNVTLYQNTAKELLQGLEAERSKCQKRIVDIVAGCKAVSSDADLVDLHIEEVVRGFGEVCARTEQLLAGNNYTSAAITDNVLALANTPLAQIDNSIVTNCGFWIKQTLLYEHHSLYDTLQCCSVAYFAQFKIALKTSSVRARYLAFAKIYGTDAMLALAPLTEQQINVFLDLLNTGTNFLGIWETKVPKGSDLSLLRPCIAVALKEVPLEGTISPQKRTDAANAVAKLVDGTQKIKLPQGVMVLDWRLIGNLYYPRGFTVGAQMSTDEQCLKHVVEETGGTAAKLEGYFMQCVEACTKGGEAWVKAGMPPEGKYEIRLKRGTTVIVWTIIVKNNNHDKPRIYHVDSGYDKSPWKN